MTVEDASGIFRITHADEIAPIQGPRAPVTSGREN